MSGIFSKEYRYFWKRGGFITATSIPATILFAFILHHFLKWHHIYQRDNELLLHIFVLVGASAPILGTLGFAVSAIYYRRKRKKFGKYDVRMRKHGRGYWIDPRDADDKKKEKDATEMNKHLKGEAGSTPKEHVPVAPTHKAYLAHRLSMFNPMNLFSHHNHPPHDIEAHPAHISASAPTLKTKHLSTVFNHPYGWTPARPRPQMKRLDSIHEMHDLPQRPAHALSRKKASEDDVSAAYKSAEDDETTRIGVVNIWSASTSVRDMIRSRAKATSKGYDGRATRMAGLKEEVEGGEGKGGEVTKKSWFEQWR